MADPQPNFSLFRVLTFIVALSTASSLLAVVPAEIKPWLVVLGTAISLGITVFFDTPQSPSVVRRLFGHK